MKRWIVVLVCVLGIFILRAAPVDEVRSLRVLRAQLQRLERDDVRSAYRETIVSGATVLARVYELSTGGYIVVSADDILPPVIAYSLTDSFGPTENKLLAELIRADLGYRLQAHALGLYSENHQAAWHDLLNDQKRRDFQQWPPDGYSTTGGWIKTLWNQTAPYNILCPMDPVTYQRSLAGCPAVAIGQVVNYHETLNGRALTDADDYHHSYAGRSYWIDDDSAPLSFPSFPQLNAYLSSLQHKWNYQDEPSSTDIAALIFASGVAAHQVYTSQGSGTFAVSQAFMAFQRLGFSGCELITDPAGNYRDRLAQNMMAAAPALLAVVTPAWDAGHNVVVDGYNTDNFFHLNFGWGGSYNGWYQLPGGLPYNLTVLEGVVVDIAPPQLLFHMPEALVFGYNVSSQQAEIINVGSQALVIEAVQVRPYSIHYDPFFWLIPSHPALPYTLGVGQSMYVSIRLVQPDYQPREILDFELAIIHNSGVYNIPVQVDTQYINSPNADEQIPSSLSVSLGPNPFRNEVTIRTQGALPRQVSVYDLRGRKLLDLSCEQASPTQVAFVWDGCDKAGRSCPAGIYLVKVNSGQGSRLLKVLKL